MVSGIAGVEDDQPRVVPPAIGKRKSDAGPPGLEWGAGRIAREVKPAGRRQPPAGAHMVVDEQPEPQQPCGPQAAAVGQHDPQRLHDMGRYAQQHLAFPQRLPHEAEIIIFEIAQPAVDQPGRSRGCAAGEIVHLAEIDCEPATCGVARDAAAIDAAADDGEVEGCCHVPSLWNTGGATAVLPRLLTTRFGEKLLHHHK